MIIILQINMLVDTEQRKFSFSKKNGNIRVGKIRYSGGKQILPEYKDYKQIIVMTKSSPYGELSPYCLKNEKNQIMENIWQFSKIYEKVSKSIQKYSRYQSFVIWNWPEDIHIKDGEITDNYWKWREAGMNSDYPIRYPVGFNERKNCVGVLLENSKKLTEKLSYIESRKKLYGPLYIELVKKEKKFKKLKKMLEKENLLICEIDVAQEDDLDYYKEKYNVSNSFIENYTMEVNETNFKIMLNDTKNSFGHGYFLACALLNKSSWLL